MAYGELVTIEDCRVVAVSTKNESVLVHNDEWDEDLWFPDSQIDDNASEIYSGCKRGDTGKLVITEWIAKQKGIL